MSKRTELEAIKKANKGILRPRQIVGWAKDHPQSELYAAFEWDDRVAGDAYRLWQARKIIALEIRYEDGHRQMYSLSIDRVTDGGYRDVEVIMASANLRKVALHDALEELNRVRMKYEHLQQLAKVWQAIKTATTQAQQSQKKTSQKKTEIRPSI